MTLLMVVPRSSPRSSKIDRPVAQPMRSLARHRRAPRHDPSAFAIPIRRPVNPTPRRLALLVSTFAVALAACAPAGTASPGASTSPEPIVAAPAVSAPVPSAPAAEGPGTTLPPTVSEPGTGNTDGRFPELSVSPAEPGYLVELVDPEAKAWKLLIAGTGELSADRLELLVEVGDVAPGVEVRTIVQGKVADSTDLTGLVGDPTAAAGGCHPTLQLCYGSGGMTIDPGEGRLSWVLERIEPGRFQVGGATASWPGEPFILGPWRTTKIFQTQ
jgi:hypothetical protein